MKATTLAACFALALPALAVADEAEVDARAEATLGAKGAVRAETGFVLRSEPDPGPALAALRAEAARFNAAASRLAEATGAVAALEELEQSLIDGNASIAELRYQMGRFPAVSRGGIWYHGMNMAENAAYEDLRANLDGLVRLRDTAVNPQRDRLARRQPRRAQAEAAEAFRIRKGAALAALDELRDALAPTVRAYRQLEADEEVKLAMARLGRGKLEPSARFAAAAAELARFERSIGRPPAAPTPSKPARKAPASKRGAR